MTIPFMDTVFLAIGKGFSPDVYLLTTKIQGILWSAADIVFIFCLLKITDMILKKDHKKPITIRYWLLLMSAMPVPLLIFTTQSSRFFIIECVVFGLQLSVMVYTIFANIKDIMNFFRKIIVDNAP